METREIFLINQASWSLNVAVSVRPNSHFSWMITSVHELSTSYYKYITCECWTAYYGMSNTLLELLYYLNEQHWSYCTIWISNRLTGRATVVEYMRLLVLACLSRQSSKFDWWLPANFTSVKLRTVRWVWTSDKGNTIPRLKGGGYSTSNMRYFMRQALDRIYLAGYAWSAILLQWDYCTESSRWQSGKYNWVFRVQRFAMNKLTHQHGTWGIWWLKSIYACDIHSTRTTVLLHDVC